MSYRELLLNCCCKMDPWFSWKKQGFNHQENWFIFTIIPKRLYIWWLWLMINIEINNIKINWATETEQPGSLHCMPTNRWPTVENPLYPYPYTYEYRSTLGTSIIRLVIQNFTKHIQVNLWSLLLKFWLIAIFSSLRKVPILTFSGWWYTYPSEKY